MSDDVQKTKKYINATCLLYVAWIVAEFAAALGLMPGIGSARGRAAAIQVVYAFGVAMRVFAALAVRGVAFLIVDLVASRLVRGDK